MDFQKAFADFPATAALATFMQEKMPDAKIYGTLGTDSDNAKGLPSFLGRHSVADLTILAERIKTDEKTRDQLAKFQPAHQTLLETLKRLDEGEEVHEN